MLPRKAFCLALAFIFFFQLTAHAGLSGNSPVPRPVGDIYVQDFANILSDREEAELRNIGMRTDDQTTNQIAVLTVESIGDATIEEYANQAYRAYGLGTQEHDNGVLLVLAMNDKKIRIEVGYGLEGIIPDGKAGRILDANAIPYLQAGQPNLAVMNTYKALANEATGDGASYPAQESQEDSSPPWLLILVIVGLIFLDIKFLGGTFTFALLSMISRGGGGGGPRGGGGGSSGGGGASRGW
ncbi:TPM domain-containing protein [Mesobacillus foraminis]|uniref:TPM domain-containing protein n=1 Tax=Mesobacillus foraminis TaxID=279826 RepID=UPI000EF44551|nr:TPM domain-containing protein [Mesobacillus foraminis]